LTDEVTQFYPLLRREGVEVDAFEEIRALSIRGRAFGAQEETDHFAIILPHLTDSGATLVDGSIDAVNRETLGVLLKVLHAGLFRDPPGIGELKVLVPMTVGSRSIDPEFLARPHHRVPLSQRLQELDPEFRRPLARHRLRAHARAG